jgi:hypothetical protein
MHYACNYDKGKEVSWFGKAHLEGDTVVMTDIWIPPQVVGGAHIEITADDLAAFWTSFYSDDTHEGDTPRDWPIWCHSHAGMGTTPSGVDTATLKILAKQFNGWVIGLVTNHRGEFSAWLNVAKPWLLEAKVNVGFQPTENEVVKAEIAAIMEANVEVEKPTPAHSWAGGQRGFGGGVPRDTRKNGQGTAGNRPSDIRFIRKSVEYPGNVEVMRADGTFVVTKDMGQVEAWEVYAKPSNKSKKKANHAADKAIAKHRQAGSSRWVTVRGEVRVGDRDHIGFDIEGAPLAVGQEKERAFNTVGQPLWDGIGLVPLNMEVYRVKGSGTASLPTSTTGVLSPEQIAEMLGLAPGVNEMDDGTIIDDGHVITLVELRSKYLVPSECADEDVVEFVAMMQNGANPLGLLNADEEAVEKALSQIPGVH